MCVCVCVCVCCLFVVFFADQLSAEIGGHFSLFSVSPRDSMSYEILLSGLNRACAAVLKDANQPRCSASLFFHMISKKQVFS